MRLRNITGSRELIGESEYVVHNIEDKKGHWKEFWGNDKPIHIEVGMGKGQFIIRLAKNNPDINYLGIEKYSSVLLRAIEKRELVEVPNIMFIRMDAEAILTVFGKDEVSKIYLNFSDPWPKERHVRRRLTSREFLQRYDRILVPDGIIEFKTDNRLLFEFSLAEVEEAGWKLHCKTFDLHHEEEMNQGNVMTEYEEKFSAMGNPIYKLIAGR